MKPRGKIREVPLLQGYSTGSQDLLSDFYLPCLSVATRYDRAVGYFRSSLFATVGIALSDFALRDGHFRLVCSPCLDKSDIDAIMRGLEMREAVGKKLDWEIDQILAHPENRPVATLLATLIAVGAMDIKLAYRPAYSGIFHAKVGIFYDAEDVVSFVGSSNETFSAWDALGNHETFEVFRSWDIDRDRSQRHILYFESLWRGDEKGVITLDFPAVLKARLLDIADSRGIAAAVEEVRREANLLPQDSLGKIVVSPSARRTLFPHQIAVVRNWINNGHRGIVHHATGSGKTLTALEIVRRWITQGRPAVILVPSEILAAQWRYEANIELDRNTAFLDVGAGAGKAKWEHVLADYTRDSPNLGPRVVIATMQTACTDAFLCKVQGGQHLLLVADEVHRIGSIQHRRILQIDAGGRLGLSATPQRFGDPQGTRLILAYFGQILDPLFELGDAIAARRLVPYVYHIHQVNLTPDEQDLWNDATERIRRAYARLSIGPDGEKLVTESFKLLLIQRARIIKQASQKADLARKVVSEHYRDDDRWLVYCDDQSQLRSVVEILGNSGLPIFEYHSAMIGSRPETLQYFRDHGGILVAIRCLDEGVDIPLVNRALILASSTNPREFIQRRGRVLRVADGKYSATIHDALVIPYGEIGADDFQAAMVRTEIRRALQFAQTAQNDSVKHEIEIITRRIGLKQIDGVEFDFEDTDEETENDGT